MEKRSRVRRRVGSAVASAALVVLGSLPATASADLVGDLVNDVDGVLNGGGDSAVLNGGGASDSPGGTKQPTESSGPTAQGTVVGSDASIQDGTDEGLFPGEDVVVGRSSAEQGTDGSYHGKVTILGLLGEELLGIETGEGETASSPFQPLQGVLDQVCTGSSNNICLVLLAANSTTTQSGSANDFGVASARLGQGDQSISAAAAESNGSLQEDGSCQTASSGSEVARVEVSDALDAHVLKSSSTSTACSGGGGAQEDDSTVAEANGNGLPDSCSGTPNGTVGAEGVASISCNGGEPGSRDAVSASLLEDQPATAGAAVASAASSAAAPAETAGSPPPSDTPWGHTGGGAGDTGAPGDDRPGGGPGGLVDGGDAAPPVSGEVQTGDGGGSLAFTGANLALLVALGLALLAAGMGVAARRPRAPMPRS
jgi:hypothetical protein